MLPKNYSQNGKNKSGGTDTLGIVLIIVFSFLLLCDITGRLILGDIGLIVQNVSIGFLGYFSYPVYLYCIIRGVFLLQNKQLGVGIGKLISLIAVFACVGIIIHLATTTGYLSGGFGAYMSAVFHGRTVGGVLLGLFAYGFSAVLTPVGAYILSAVIIIALLLFVAGVFGGRGASRVKKRKVSSAASARIKGGTSYVGNGQDLFIESIIPPSPDNNVPGTMDDLPDEQHSRNYGKNYDGYTDGSYDRMNGSRYSQDSRSQVSPEIERMNKMVDERYNQIRERSRDAWGIPDARNDYSAAQPDYGRNSGYSSKAWEDYIPTVPPKDVRSKMVNGEIIRGFDPGDIGPVSRRESGYNTNSNGYGYGSGGSGAGGYFDRNPRSDAQVSGNSIRFSMDDIKQDSYKAMYDSYAPERAKYPSKPEIKIVESKPESYFDFPEPVQQTEPDPAETKTRAPIINASEVEPEVSEPENFQLPEKQPEKEEVKRAPIINGSSVIADEPYISEATEEKEEPKKINPAPIIRGSHFEEDLKKAREAEKQAVKPDENKPITAQSPANSPETEQQTNNVSSLTENKVAAQEKTFIQSVSPEKTVNSESNPESKVDLTEFSDDKSSAADFDANEKVFDDNDNKAIESKNPIIDGDENDLLISDEDEDYPEIDEDDLTAEEYMEIYGRPKFVDVSKEDSDKLSEKFEKNTTSFNIIDEVEDASENVKRGLAEPAVQNNEATSPEKNSVAQNKTSVADKTDEKEQPAPKKPKKPYKYTPPSIDLLTTESTIPKIDPETYEEKKELLEQTLSNLGIPAKVIGITVGPTVTRYELNMPVGMSVKKIDACEQDVRYGLACKGNIRIESPIPGKRAVGIEVPNDQNALVALKDIICSKEFKSSPSPLTIALGEDIQGKIMITRIDKMPHLLIAGTTGSGKSACLNSLIVSLLYKASPEDVKLILVDPKRVEFTAYSGLPHMMIPDAITEPAQALNAFKWAREEMERRYKELQAHRVRNISEYNNLEDVKNHVIDKLPYIVLIVDEFADLMISSNTDKKRELENLISSIAGKARAAGIHLILATQRPSSDVITGTIKSNLPCRIAFAVSNQTNSRIILDKNGAESLLGKGDMLFAPQENPEGVRIQGAFIDNDEVNNIVDQIKANNSCEFDEEFEKALVDEKEESDENKNIDSDEPDDSGYDQDLPDIVRLVIRTGQASVSMIQRRFSIGYQRACKIIDQMERFNFIGPYNGSKAREVYVTREKFKEFFGEDVDDD